MIDILEAVNDFILAYAQGQDLPTLTQNQIIRSWQNLDNILSQTQALKHNETLTMVLKLRNDYFVNTLIQPG